MGAGKPCLRGWTSKAGINVAIQESPTAPRPGSGPGGDRGCDDRLPPELVATISKMGNYWF